MTPPGFDPWREQARLAWRNRVARWRADRAQTAFHALAWLALAVVAGVPLLRNVDAWGGGLLDAWQRWPVPISLSLALVFALRQAQAWARVQRAQAGDWLAALPVASRVARGARWRALRRQALAQGAVLLVALIGVGLAAMHRAEELLAAAHRLRDPAVANAADDASFVEAMGRAMDTLGASHDAWRSLGFAGLLAIVAGALLAPALSRAMQAVRRRRIAAPTASVIPDHGAGRVWRWQRLAGGVALHGRTLAWGALAWLLVPMDGGVGALFALGLAGIGLAGWSRAWRRSLAVLPQAQAWLAAQPLPRGAMLRASWAVPCALLAALVALVAALSFALVPALAMPAAAGVFALGALQFAVTAAWRRTPSRIALAWAVQVALLLGVLQGFPIAALPLWMVQMIVWLRKARA